MNKSIAFSIIIVLGYAAQTVCMIDVQSFFTDDICNYVLEMANLKSASSGAITAQSTLSILDNFFKENNVKNYTDAARFGKERDQFYDPRAFNSTMNQLLVKNQADIVPYKNKQYQALIFTPSGIDIFMERLAFVSRLMKVHGLQTEEVITFVSKYPHRDDLKSAEYLLRLPTLFNADFDLRSFDKKVIEPFIAQKEWTHADGMQAAWKLIECDPDMATLKSKVRYSALQCEGQFSTDQHVDYLIKHELRKSISPRAPIAFVVTSQFTILIQKLFKKYCASNDGSVDILIAQPLAPEVELELYNGTMQQRAMARLFHFYHMLLSLWANLE